MSTEVFENDVLIVAKCIVNLVQMLKDSGFIKVLIVAKCIVNTYCRNKP